MASAIVVQYHVALLEKRYAFGVVGVFVGFLK
jgi:hypothetical protein